jgi:nucleoside 2-deoxyribosyltransferase
MWFDPSQDSARDAIKVAIAAAGYSPIRMDEVQHINRIDDEIIARIRRSRFMVADFTGQNQGVYFEAGYMLGLGRPVLWVCNDSESKKVHFDARQYNTIFYTNLDDLKSRLQLRIEAILGKGPISV